MAPGLVRQADRLSAERFTDATADRAALPAGDNQYFRSAADPLYSADTEDLQALLRPLFITSWLIDDFMADNNFFGAHTPGGPRGAMLLSSASSKTAYGTAFQLHQREGIEVIGLPSPANVAFCESLGCYDRVLTYDALDQIAADTPCVYVDFAGNGGLRQAIHTRFANLKYSCSIGGTHVEQLAAGGAGKNLPGPARRCSSPRHRSRNAPPNGVQKSSAYVWFRPGRLLWPRWTTRKTPGCAPSATGGVMQRWRPTPACWAARPTRVWALSWRWHRTDGLLAGCGRWSPFTCRWNHRSLWLAHEVGRHHLDVGLVEAVLDVAV